MITVIATEQLKELPTKLEKLTMSLTDTLPY